MYAPNTALLIDSSSTPAPATSRRGAATGMAGAFLASDSTSRQMVPAGTVVRGSWRLSVPMLYELDRGTEGFFASWRWGSVHGYGASERRAVRSLMHSMADILESLNNTPDQQLDRSALDLRGALRKQLRNDV